MGRYVEYRPYSRALRLLNRTRASRQSRRELTLRPTRLLRLLFAGKRSRIAVDAISFPRSHRQNAHSCKRPWEERVQATSLKTRILGYVAAAALVVCAGVAPHAQAQQQILVIQGGTLIDGNGGPPVPNSVIVIQGNRITQVGRAGA